jgi:drug/metabolite transporter (DMT)-like permease
MRAISRRERWLAHLAMLAFAALIALGFSLSALIKTDITTGPLNTARFLFGTLIMAAVARPASGARLALPRAPWRFGLLGLLSAVYFITMFVALTLSPPIAISALFTLIPLLAAGLAFLIMRQRAGPVVLLSLLVAAAGSVWVIFKGSLGAILAFEIGQGEVVFLLGCAAYALYTVLLRHLNRGEPSAVASFWTLAATTLWVALYGLPELVATDWMHLRPLVWWVIAYLAVFPSAATFFLVQYAALRLPAAKVIAYGYLTPAFVILYEGLAGHGWPSPSVLAGAAVTILGLILLAVLPG